MAWHQHIADFRWRRFQETRTGTGIAKSWPCKLGFLLAAFAALPVFADDVTVQFNGTITSVKTTVINELNTADPLTLTLVYDSNAVPVSGNFELAFDAPPATSLAIALGPHVFTAQQDLDYGSGFPTVGFADGEVVAVNMVVVDALENPPSDLDIRNSSLTISNPVDGNIVQGSFDFSNPQIVTPPAVSVPSLPQNLAIFFLVIVSLIGAARLRVGKGL